MDAFTKKIHFLIVCAREQLRKTVLSVTDVEDLVYTTNEISRLVLGEVVFNPKNLLSDEVVNSVNKLAKNKDILVLDREQVGEREDFDILRFDREYALGDKFIFDQYTLLDRPSSISEEQVNAIEFAIKVTFAQDPKQIFNEMVFIDALKWALDFQKEKFGFASKSRKANRLVGKANKERKKKLKEENEESNWNFDRITNFLES